VNFEHQIRDREVMDLSLTLCSVECGPKQATRARVIK